MATPCGTANPFGLTKYDGDCEFFGEGETAVPEALGWIVVVLLGAVFAALTSVLVYLDRKYAGEQESSEHFNTAGRSVKTGLVCADIVSKWTWAATLLQSANVAYKFGVSGPFWYAAGATIQVLLFGILAVEIKRKCPTCHTFLEIIKIRWGTTAHLVFFCFAIATNIIVTAMLILGGAACIEALSGMDTVASAFLIPVGVMFYTAHGGLKATFLASWFNTAVIMISMCIFIFSVYASPNSDLGSPGKVFDNLQVVSALYPVKGNRDGSFLTMFSESGIIFGIINIIGNFGTVFVDQSYWQGAIAAKPSATWRGYLLGGLCWFSIPFSMATAMGLGARALALPISIEESDAGLTPPALAVHLMGTGGGFLCLFQLFMAVTATGNAEQMAVGALWAYDIYRPYINPKADGPAMIKQTRIVVCIYAVVSGGVACILMKLGLSLGWVYLFMGIIIGSAVFPVAASLTWRNCSAAGAVIGAVVGQWCAIITWLVCAKGLYGEVTVATTGMDYPMLAGNLVALFFSAMITAAVSWMYPQDFDWALLKEIPMVDQDPNEDIMAGEDSPEELTKALHAVWWWGGVLTLVLIIIWPCLALPIKVFNKTYW